MLIVIATKFEVEIFNGKRDYLLWKKKMRDVLVQQKVVKAIDKTYHAGMIEDKKLEIDKIASSTVILHLSNSVLRKVDDMKSTTELWQKLD